MKRIDKILKEQVEAGKTPSAQYILFNKEEVLHSFCDGFADITNQKKADKHTIYSAFSATKTFTALGVLQLAEEGKVDIDESAAKYLSRFPYPNDITVRQLLSHSAGISNPNPLTWIYPPAEQESFDRDAFFKEVFKKNHKLKSAPNQKFSYSNLGYVLLGQLIEAVSGQKYEDYIKIRVMDPLGLGPESLSFEIPGSDILAKGYHKKNSLMNWIMGFYIDKKVYRGPTEGRWQPFKPLYITGTSYGGLMGTPVAFMRYLQELLKENCTLLTPEYKQILFTENHTADKHPTGMSLSWFTDDLKGEKYFAHAGGGGGYYCEIRLYPDAGIGSVIMFNRSGMKDERFLDKLDNYYFEKSN